jgi:hypothetical protein
MEEPKMPVSGFHRFPSFSGLSRALITGLLFLSTEMCVFGQTELATVLGRVTDPSGAVVAGAQVEIRNVDTNLAVMSGTNGDGLYTIPSLHPGHYVISVRKAGFKTVSVTQLDLNVQDNVVRNFVLEVGSSSESITVTAESERINTTDATVSTVVDRNFAENLPMNGRSFQTLIDLTPGVVPTAAGGLDSGQFSVNGQRASSNYWTVDGVSANVGSSTLLGGNGTAGAVGTSSVLGGTNSLVSVDALQEFRIQTSTFAPEFGRTPGAQISIVTRSGGNQFHGSLFDYLRNDIFDAGNWFNGYTNNPPLPKAEERQNDFGATFSGPIFKNRTFFFFSYEGLRLRLPTTTLTTVPDLNARQNAMPTMQPYLNAYPLPNGPPAVDSQGNLIPGAAGFNKSYSNPATIDAYSIRVDHHLNDKLTLFGRYSYSPSETLQRGIGNALSSVNSSRITTQTGTIGSTWLLSPHSTNEMRFNYSRTNAFGRNFLDTFGGAVPLSTLSFPSPYSEQNASLTFILLSLVNGGAFQTGAFVRNLQRQVNLVDNFSFQKGTHDLKFGVDYRNLSPVYAPFRYGQLALFSNVPSAENGTLLASILESEMGATLLFRNLGAFMQDTWHVTPRLNATYGVRWDTDFAPSSIDGPTLAAVTGFNLSDLSHLALAPAGTHAFKTTYGNFAPRVGIAYQLSQRPDWNTVARSGFGLFYDLATSEAANIILRGGYPFSSPFFPVFGGTFPLGPTESGPAPIQPPSSANPGAVAAFDPNLKLPYALQWNVALEQGLGGQQSLSASYIGSVGRRLIQTAEVASPNPTIQKASLVTNTATSDYGALQLQFQRRLVMGLQLLGSYTWSHSIDSASAGSAGNGSNLPTSAANQRANRASSDYDIRHVFSAGVTYAIPAPRAHPFANVIIRGWSLQSIIQVHTATPVEVIDGNFNQLTNGFTPDIRPDIVQGIPLYLYGPQYPGGKAINFTAGAVAGGCSDGSQSIGPFCPPPTDANGNALRQGTLSRNALRGFGLTQWDFALHRDIQIHESVILRFRAEMFNLLNHPNFAPPVGDISQPQFGLSAQTFGQFLGGGNLGSGGFSSLYQVGGPRSMQFALRLTF